MGVQSGGNSERNFWLIGPEVNLAEINRQHQNFIRIIQDLHTAVSSMRGKQVIGVVLAELVTYTIYHFAAEESLMQQHGFPGLAAHRKDHCNLTMKLCGFQEEYDAERPQAVEGLLKYLQHWMEEHTLKRDNEYVHFLNGLPKSANEGSLNHLLNNKLAIIMGTCDLISQTTTDPSVLADLRIIFEAAKAIDHEINKHESKSAGA